jgi:RHS repeat-associated protein
MMADDPCEAALSGADPTGPRKYYRARYYDPKLGRFISEDPIRWIAGPNFFSYVDNNPVILTDPFGLITKGRGEADKANAWLADCWLNAFGAAGVFVAQNQRMRDNNTIGVDKYFHCMANCEGTKQGPCGAGASQILSFVREAYGAAKGDPAQDRRDDFSANAHGRTCPPTQTCAQRCEPLLPSHLPPGFLR